MDNEYIQEILDEALAIANKYAENGVPIKMIWIPPQSGSSKPTGCFAVKEGRFSNIDGWQF